MEYAEIAKMLSRAVGWRYYPASQKSLKESAVWFRNPRSE